MLDLSHVARIRRRYPKVFTRLLRLPILSQPRHAVTHSETAYARPERLRSMLGFRRHGRKLWTRANGRARETGDTRSELTMLARTVAHFPVEADIGCAPVMLVGSLLASKGARRRNRWAPSSCDRRATAQGRDGPSDHVPFATGTLRVRTHGSEPTPSATSPTLSARTMGSL
jgi:hypothetical protein